MGKLHQSEPTGAAPSRLVRFLGGGLGIFMILTSLAILAMWTFR
jgi:hypothetical protein